jgi:hypothetical protein
LPDGRADASIFVLRIEHAVITLPCMERSPLASRAVVSAGYDPTSQALELEFASGRIYQYQGVPPGTYDWLLRAASKGAYVTRMIKDRYPYRDVTPATVDAARDLADTLRASLCELAREEPPR